MAPRCYFCASTTSAPHDTAASDIHFNPFDHTPDLSFIAGRFTSMECSSSVVSSTEGNDTDGGSADPNAASDVAEKRNGCPPAMPVCTSGLAAQFPIALRFALANLPPDEVREVPRAR
jgi:hypothetical protein